MKIEDYGFIGEKTDEIIARITAEHRDYYEFWSELGTGLAKLKGSSFYYENQAFPTTGDFVIIDYNEIGDSRINRTLERRTLFSRSDGFHTSKNGGVQAVAANFDYVFIIQSLNMDFNIKRLDRYLSSAWQSGAVPVFILSKADLDSNYMDKKFLIEENFPGVDCHVISAKTGFGLEEIAKYFTPGKTTTFLGSSGIGKSSLVNALANNNIMNVSGIREDDSKGHHTTTHRQLIMLNNGAMVIDTPGMRELGLAEANEGIDKSFVGISELINGCRFSNCTHNGEPGCKICEAIENGSLDTARWESYLKLQKESSFHKKKEQYKDMRAKKAAKIKGKGRDYRDDM